MAVDKKKAFRQIDQYIGQLKKIFANLERVNGRRKWDSTPPQELMKTLGLDSTRYLFQQWQEACESYCVDTPKLKSKYGGKAYQFEKISKPRYLVEREIIEKRKAKKELRKSKEKELKLKLAKEILENLSPEYRNKLGVIKIEEYAKKHNITVAAATVHFMKKP